MLKQTRAMIAKETALIVFLILVGCAYLEYQNRIADAARPKPWLEEPGPDCVSDGVGNVQCEYRRDPDRIGRYR